LFAKKRGGAKSGVDQTSVDKYWGGGNKGRGKKFTPITCSGSGIPSPNKNM